MATVRRLAQHVCVVQQKVALLEVGTAVQCTHSRPEMCTLPESPNLKQHGCCTAYKLSSAGNKCGHDPFVASAACKQGGRAHLVERVKACWVAALFMRCNMTSKDAKLSCF